MSETLSSPESERAILGAVLFSSAEAFNQAASRLSVSDFALDSHRRIYSAMEKIINAGGAVDQTTLGVQLEIDGNLQAVGGHVYISNLTDGLPRVKNIGHYVEAVREKARLRMLKAAFNDGLARIDDLEKSDEVVGSVQETMLEIINHGRSAKTPSISEIASEAFTQIVGIRDAKDRGLIGLSTGLGELDDMTTGFRNGEFYVIGGRPGQGKSAMACQSIQFNCNNGRKCAFFSIEMDRIQVMNRLAAMESGIPLFQFRDPRFISPEKLDHMARTMKAIGEWPLVIEDASRITINELTATARLFISQGAEIIFVDYLQKVRSQHQKAYDRVTAVSEGLWELAKSTNVPVVALCQLRRGEKGEAPTLEDLRESGQIEQDAHAVFLLHRPKDENGFTGEDEILLAKQRSGPAGGHISVVFDGKSGMYLPRTTSETHA